MNIKIIQDRLKNFGGNVGTMFLSEFHISTKEIENLCSYIEKLERENKALKEMDHRSNFVIRMLELEDEIKELKDTLDNYDERVKKALLDASKKLDW